MASMFAKSSSDRLFDLAERKADARKDTHQTTVKISHFQQSRTALRHQCNLTLIALVNFASRLQRQDDHQRINRGPPVCALLVHGLSLHRALTYVKAARCDPA